MSVHRVVALLPDHVAAFELGIVVEVFGLDRPELDVPWWYELTLCTETPGRLPATTGGFGFVVDHGLEALEDADTIIVPGWNGEPSGETDANRVADDLSFRSSGDPKISGALRPSTASTASAHSTSRGPSTGCSR